MYKVQCFSFSTQSPLCPWDSFCLLHWMANAVHCNVLWSCSTMRSSPKHKFSTQMLLSKVHNIWEIYQHCHFESWSTLYIFCICPVLLQLVPHCKWSPRSSTAIFVAVDGPPEPIMAATDGLPLPQMGP